MVTTGSSAKLLMLSGVVHYPMSDRKNGSNLADVVVVRHDLDCVLAAVDGLGRGRARTLFIVGLCAHFWLTFASRVLALEFRDAVKAATGGVQ